MNTKLILIFIFILGTVTMLDASTNIPLPVIPSSQFLITDYGATTTSENNAAAINAAITAANSAGGGTVVLPAGTFLSGIITMKSNVRLLLQSGDTLRILPYGSGNGTLPNTYPNNGTTDQYNPFIFGASLSNIEVSGSGVIDGQGQAWWTAYQSNSNMKRPSLIRFKSCNTVLVTGITLMNSPGVHLTMGQSSSVLGTNATISHLTIKAPSTSPNTDAIDTWYWNGIYIHDCYLSVGDDDVAMDSYTQNITIKHLTCTSGHGISVGSYATGVNTITVDSCSLTTTDNGLRLKAARDRGGSESLACTNVSYSNITMKNVTNPIYVTSYYFQTGDTLKDPAQAVTSTTPTWKNISYKNITITGSPTAGYIWGLPESPVKNLTFDNVKISATTQGITIIHADSVVFKNCSSITIPSGKGNAIYKQYDLLRFSGINSTTGKSTSCTTEVELPKSTQAIRCFPLQTKGKITIESNDTPIDYVTLYSLTGKSVISIGVGHTLSTEVDISSLNLGFYIIKVSTIDGKIFTDKVIRN
ncbi:MAG: glycosyl hydrolase family 28 protein [Paludibacter sp.]